MKSIKTKIMTYVILLSLGISFVFSLIAGFALYKTAMQGLENSLSSTMNGYTASIENAINTYKIAAESVAMDSRITDSTLSMEQKKEVLSDYASRLGFKDISVSNADGKTYNSTDIADREYFIEAMKGNTYVSSPVLRRTDSSTILFVSSKINNDSDYNGIVYCALDHNTFSEMIANAKIGEKGYSFAVDKTGTFIAHPTDTMVKEFVNYTTQQNDSKDKDMAVRVSIINDMKAQKEGVGVISGSSGKEDIIYAPIPNTDGWSLGIVANNREMLEKFYSNVTICIIAAVVIMIISIFVAIAIAVPISNPIILASERLNKLSLGDISSDVPKSNSKDETNQLLNAIELTVSTWQAYIKDIENVLNNIANNNLSVDTTQEYVGDFAAIKISLNKITQSLNQTVYEIKTSSEQVSSGANQVSSGAQALSQGATEQASSVQQLAATINDISGKIRNTAANSIEAGKTITGASDAVNLGRSQMHEMQKAMDEITNSSNEIAKIIKTIDDIAFQTNILALNAAVEAARAGTAGKGFAVVADEVRSLASKSAAAADVTTNLIEKSIQTVRNGQKIAVETATTLESIVSGANASVDIINHISVAANEQAESVVQISGGVDQISSVIQTNSATAEESAAASEELSAQAQILQDLVERFTLK